MAGSDIFAVTAALFRTVVKDSIVPFLCDLAAQESSTGQHIITEPFNQLISIGINSSKVMLLQTVALQLLHVNRLDPHACH